MEPSPAKLPQERTLGAEELQRLEAIVERVDCIHRKFWLYRRLGNKAKADQYQDVVLREVVNELEDALVLESKTLERNINLLEEIGADRRIIDKYVHKVYARARVEWQDHLNKDTPHRLTMNAALLMMAAAKRLGLPEDALAEIREGIVYCNMTGRYCRTPPPDSVEQIAQATKDLSPERIKAVAEQIYEEYMQQGEPASAGGCAIQYNLGRDKVLAAAKKWLKRQNYDLEELQQITDRLDLPDELVRPAVHETCIKLETDPSSPKTNYDHLAIVGKFKPSAEEIQSAVQKEYELYMKNGAFGLAIKLKEKHPSLIKDTAALEDLYFLDKLQAFR